MNSQELLTKNFAGLILQKCRANPVLQKKPAQDDPVLCRALIWIICKIIIVSISHFLRFVRIQNMKKSSVLCFVLEASVIFKAWLLNAQISRLNFLLVFASKLKLHGFFQHDNVVKVNNPMMRVYSVYYLYLKWMVLILITYPFSTGLFFLFQRSPARYPKDARFSSTFIWKILRMPSLLHFQVFAVCALCSFAWQIL